MKIGVLVSGRGTNLGALLAAQLDVAVVISNTPDAGALGIARSAHVAAAVVDHRPFKGDRAAFEDALDSTLRRHGVELVVLAGFMRVLSPHFVRRWPQRIVNIHPSLLPAFPGAHAHRDALAAGVKVSGCTVHFVDEGTDTGPIIAQAVVPVREGDTEETLAARVLVEEHRILPEAVRRVAAGRVTVEGRKVNVLRDVPLISACLVGERCRWDGRDATADVGELGISYRVCPEMVAGLGVPRPAMELTADGGVVVVKTRKDVTGLIADACDQIVKNALDIGVTVAILKDKSPSCGSKHVWKDGQLVAGEGLLAPRLRAAGIRVVTSP